MIPFNRKYFEFEIESYDNYKLKKESTGTNSESSQ
jgi:hypothetical protein